MPLTMIGMNRQPITWENPVPPVHAAPVQVSDMVAPEAAHEAALATAFSSWQQTSIGDHIERSPSPQSPPSSHRALSTTLAPSSSEYRHYVLDVAIARQKEPHISHLAHSWRLNTRRIECQLSPLNERQLFDIATEARRNIAPMEILDKRKEKLFAAEHPPVHQFITQPTCIRIEQHGDGTKCFINSDSSMNAFYPDQTHITYSAQGHYEIQHYGSNVDAIREAYNNAGIWFTFPPEITHNAFYTANNNR